MKESLLKIYIVFITVMLMSCKEVYNPPATAQTNHYLVVDGTIVNGQDSTIIKLSRTRNFADADLPSPESQAQVTVIGDAGENYPLIEQGTGRYVIDQLNLNTNETYQLKIVTTDGKEYLSDKIGVNHTPPIDSVSWRQDSAGVTVYVNTHDPQNNTRYYRWDYTETWQYHTEFVTYADIQNGVPVARTQQIYDCWMTDNSTNIEIASSVKLSQDIIFQNPIATIPTGSEKIAEKYSILVRQYAISSTGYDYFENLKKNSEQLGTLFDGQPSQLNSNIHCVSVPDEPVLGYIEASNVDTARIFISKNSVNLWNYQSYTRECMMRGFSDPDSILIYFPDNQRRSYVFLGINLGTYLYSTLMCGDCTDHGGKNIKPSFWP